MSSEPEEDVFASEPEEDVLALSFEGYLFKQGGTRKSWKKRYFELKNGELLYYKSENKKKLKGTLPLTEGWGVRSKNDTSCEWPPGILPSECFGLAMNYRTYYFYSKDSEIENWKESLQAVINAIGDPNDDPSDDFDGQPEGTKSKMARSALSLGAKATKAAINMAPVDDSIKDLVSTGADMVGEQAEADPDTDFTERLQMGANAAGDLIEQIGELDIEEIDSAVDLAKDLGKGLKKGLPLPKDKKGGKVPGGGKALAKPAGGAKDTGKPAGAAKGKVPGGKVPGGATGGAKKVAGGLGKAASGTKSIGKVAAVASKGAAKAAVKGAVGGAIGDDEEEADDKTARKAGKAAGKATGKAAGKKAGKVAAKGAAKGKAKGKKKK